MSVKWERQLEEIESEIPLYKLGLEKVRVILRQSFSHESLKEIPFAIYITVSVARWLMLLTARGKEFVVSSREGSDLI